VEKCVFPLRQYLLIWQIAEWRGGKFIALFTTVLFQIFKIKPSFFQLSTIGFSVSITYEFLITAVQVFNAPGMLMGHQNCSVRAAISCKYANKPLT